MLHNLNKWTFSVTLKPRSASATCSSSKDNLYKDLGSPELLQQGRSPRTRSNPGSGGNSPQRLDTGRSNPSSPQQGESVGQRSPLPECSGYNASTGKSELFLLSARWDICSLSGENLFYFSILIFCPSVYSQKLELQIQYSLALKAVIFHHILFIKAILAATVMFLFTQILFCTKMFLLKWQKISWVF